MLRDLLDQAQRAEIDRRRGGEKVAFDSFIHLAQDSAGRSPTCSFPYDVGLRCALPNLRVLDSGLEAAPDGAFRHGILERRMEWGAQAYNAVERLSMRPAARSS